MYENKLLSKVFYLVALILFALGVADVKVDINLIDLGLVFTAAGLLVG